MSKKALLIGIVYKGSSCELNGCINDVNNVKNYLLLNGYHEDNITIMTEETNLPPTKVNMLSEIQKLFLSDSKYKFLYYSGHGSSIRDIDGDEDDGKDEVLVPLDYGKMGFITDDLLRKLLKLLEPTDTLFAIFDCCHSGTGLDLKYTLKQRKKGILNKILLRKNEYYWKNNIRGQKTKAKVYLISGCMDSQTSADAYLLNQYQGALTCHLLAILNKLKYNLVTWVDIVDGVNYRLGLSGFKQKSVLTVGRFQKLSTLFSYF